MDMKTHIVRAVKYLIWLALLFTLVFALMISTGTSRVGAGEALHELFGSSRGMLMIATIVVLALLYPRFGFTRLKRIANVVATIVFLCFALVVIVFYLRSLGVCGGSCAGF